MKDQDLLRGLAEAARKQNLEDARWDDPWDAFAASKLSDSEIEKLRNQAEGSDTESLALELFRPISESTRRKIVNRLKSELSQAAHATQDQGNLVELRPHPHKTSRIVLAAASLAAAAVLALVLWYPKSEGPVLPAYRLSLFGQIKINRSTQTQPTEIGKIPSYRAGSVLEIVLRPEHAVEGPVHVSVYLERQGRFKPIGIDAESDPQGSWRIRGVVGKDIRLAPGVWTLWAAVARSETDLEPEQLMAAKAAGSAQVMTVKIMMVENADN